MQSKQINRFFQSIHYFKVTSNTSDFNVFNSLKLKINKPLHLHFYSCSKNLLRRLVNTGRVCNPSLEIIPNLKYLKNSKISFSQTTSLDTFNQNLDTHPLNIYHSKLMYHPLILSNDISTLNSLNSLYHNLFRHNMQVSLTIYSILILLSLLRIK
jgi:hypothetical protein